MARGHFAYEKSRFAHQNAKVSCFLFSLLTCLHTTTFTLPSIFPPWEMIGVKIWETSLSLLVKCSLRLPSASQKRACSQISIGDVIGIFAIEIRVRLSLEESPDGCCCQFRISDFGFRPASRAVCFSFCNH